MVFITFPKLVKLVQSPGLFQFHVIEKITEKPSFNQKEKLSCKIIARQTSKNIIARYSRSCRTGTLHWVQSLLLPTMAQIDMNFHMTRKQSTQLLFIIVFHSVKTFPASIPCDYIRKRFMDQKVDQKQKELLSNSYSQTWTTKRSRRIKKMQTLLRRL